jgi:exonuclease VII large subunit
LTALKLERLRDEVRALSFLVTDKVQLQNECEKLKKEIDLIQQEEKKFRKLTCQVSKKLIQQSIQLTDKAAFAANHNLSAKLHGLQDEEEEASASSPFQQLNKTFSSNFLEMIPEVNASTSTVLTTAPEFDPEAIWKLQSNSTSRLQSKLKKIKSELKFLSRSFSMQEL